MLGSSVEAVLKPYDAGNCQIFREALSGPSFCPSDTIMPLTLPLKADMIALLKPQTADPPTPTLHTRVQATQRSSRTSIHRAYRVLCE